MTPWLHALSARFGQRHDLFAGLLADLCGRRIPGEWFVLVATGRRSELVCEFDTKDLAHHRGHL